MITKDVESNLIEQIGYDDTDKSLYVKFKNGGKVYQYFDVEFEKFAELSESESAGKYFHAEIKNKHQYVLVEEEIF